MKKGRNANCNIFEFKSNFRANDKLNISQLINTSSEKYVPCMYIV